MTLLAQAPDGVLSTVAVDPAGFPYGSLVLFGVLGHDPVFLISGLATHTRNLRADSRASLLVKEAGGLVTDTSGNALEFSTCRDGATLPAHVVGVLATNRDVHPDVLRELGLASIAAADKA